MTSIFGESDFQWNRHMTILTIYSWLSVDEEYQEPPAWRKVINFLCGIDNKPKDQGPDLEIPDLSKEDEAKQAAESLEEDPSWKRWGRVLT